MTLKASQILFLLYIIINVSVKGRIRVSPGDGSALLFLTFIAFLLTSLFSEDSDRSLVLSIAFLFCILFFFATNIYLHSTSSSFRELIKTLYASSLIYSIYGILQLLLFFSGHEANVHFEAWDLVPRVPYFSAENVHAAFIILVIPFIYQDILTASKASQFTRFLAAFLINLGGLLATGSRGAILALVIAVTIQSIIFAIKNRSKHGLKKASVIFTIIAIFSIKYWDALFIRFNALANGDDGTTSVRISQYEFIFNKFLDHPFLGIGLGQSLIISGHDVHNVFLQVLFEGGVIAFSFYFLFIALPFIKLFISRRVTMKLQGGRPLAAFSGASAVLLQAMAEPSMYFYHLYLSLSLIIFVSSKKFSSQH